MTVSCRLRNLIAILLIPRLNVILPSILMIGVPSSVVILLLLVLVIATVLLNLWFQGLMLRRNSSLGLKIHFIPSLTVSCGIIVSFWVFEPKYFRALDCSSFGVPSSHVKQNFNFSSMFSFEFSWLESHLFDFFRSFSWREQKGWAHGWWFRREGFIESTYQSKYQVISWNSEKLHPSWFLGRFTGFCGLFPSTVMVIFIMSGSKLTFWPSFPFQTCSCSISWAWLGWPLTIFPF